MVYSINFLILNNMFLVIQPKTKALTIRLAVMKKYPNCSLKQLALIKPLGEIAGQYRIGHI